MVEDSPHNVCRFAVTITTHIALACLLPQLPLLHPPHNRRSVLSSVSCLLLEYLVDHTVQRRLHIFFLRLPQFATFDANPWLLRWRSFIDRFSPHATLLPSQPVSSFSLAAPSPLPVAPRYRLSSLQPSIFKSHPFAAISACVCSICLWNMSILHSRVSILPLDPTIASFHNTVASFHISFATHLYNHIF